MLAQLLAFLLLLFGFNTEVVQLQTTGFVPLNFTSSECKNGWQQKLVLADFESATICFPNDQIDDRRKAKSQKPTRRFKLEISGEVFIDGDPCEKCISEGTCLNSIEYNWIKMENIGQGHIKLESNLLPGKEYSYHQNACVCQDVQKLSHELSHGAFITDLLKKDFKIDFFLLLIPAVGSFISDGNKYKPIQPINATTHRTSVQTNDETTTTTTAVTSINRRLPINYSMKMNKSLTNETTIKFHVKLEEEAETLLISLLHDAPEFHPFLGETLLRIDVNFTTYKDYGNIFHGSYVNGSWFNNGTWTDESKKMFKSGEEFTCTMLLTATGLTKNMSITVFINEKRLGEFVGNWPIWAVNWLQIAGNITIVDEPVIDYGHEENLFKKEFDHLLHNDDVLCLEGMVNVGQHWLQHKYFGIFLFHGAHERNDVHSFFHNKGIIDGSDFEVGVVVLFLLPRDGQTVVDSILPGRGKLTTFPKYHNIEFKENEKFFIKINVSGNGYKININSSKVVSFEDPLVPPWAAEWLTVYGGINVTLVTNSNCTGQRDLPVNIKKLYPDKLLKVGNEIGVTGQIENATTTPVEISMFRKALDWSEYFGQTVLRIQVSTDTLNCNSFSQKKWAFATPLHVPLIQPLISEQNFTLKIAVKEKFYAISYGDEGLVLRYPHVMPIWAVHYITVKGLKLPNITIQP